VALELLQRLSAALRRQTAAPGSMRIESIYVAGWRGDLRFTQCCIASIRRWYPTIDICLIKDYIDGDYDTADLEQAFNVRVFDGPRQHYGWGVAKLEPLFLPTRHRCLILDSDIVFAGPVLAELERTNEDFVLVMEAHAAEAIRRDYFDPEEVERRFPGYAFPGWVSNTGQFVGTTGILRREDFLPYLQRGTPLDSPFKSGEQGVLNFILHSKLRQKQITLRRLPFMHWPPGMKPDAIDIDRLMGGRGYPFLLHWAGPKTRPFEEMPMSPVLAYFEALYKARVAS
jgi:hypothetical protein